MNLPKIPYQGTNHGSRRILYLLQFSTLKVNDYRQQCLFFLHPDKNSHQGVLKQFNSYLTLSPDFLMPGDTMSQPQLSYTFHLFDVKLLIIETSDTRCTFSLFLYLSNLHFPKVRALFQGFLKVCFQAI